MDWKDFRLKRQLRQIVKDANDDLYLIREAGPHYYSNTELYALLERLNSEESEALRLNYRLFVLLASLTIWIAGFFLFEAFNVHWGANICFTLLVAKFLIFSVGIVYIHRRYRHFRFSSRLRMIIQQELERRRKDASIS